MATRQGAGVLAHLDVTKSARIRGDGPSIADEIRRRTRDELGVTASVGVSFNKIFAKLGSDMKKPDATTVITEENFRDKVWPLPVQDLLYVGPATTRKLHRIGVTTIGGLARLDPAFLRARFGKWGEVLHTFANGYDQSPVAQTGDERVVKGVGNSSTAPRDLETLADVRRLMFVLCESVAERLREHGLKGKTVQISVRDKFLVRFERQGKLSRATYLSKDLHDMAMALFAEHYDLDAQPPLRSIGIRATDLVPANTCCQLSLFEDEVLHQKRDRLEEAVIDLRRRFGHEAIGRAVLLGDRIGQINPKDDHVIHPVGFFREGPVLFPHHSNAAAF